MDIKPTLRPCFVRYGSVFGQDKQLSDDWVTSACKLAEDDGRVQSNANTVQVMANPTQ